MLVGKILVMRPASVVFLLIVGMGPTVLFAFMALRGGSLAVQVFLWTFAVLMFLIMLLGLYSAVAHLDSQGIGRVIIGPRCNWDDMQLITAGASSETIEATLKDGTRQALLPLPGLPWDTKASTVRRATALARMLELERISRSTI